MADERHTPVGRREIDNLLATLGEKAEHTPKEKGMVLEDVLEKRRAKTRGMLAMIGASLVILGILFYFALKKYYSQFN
jgi:hypothetical protein